MRIRIVPDSKQCFIFLVSISQWKNPSIIFLPISRLPAHSITCLEIWFFCCLFYKTEMGGRKCIFKVMLLCLLIFYVLQPSNFFWHLVANIQEYSRPFVLFTKPRKTLIAESLHRKPRKSHGSSVKSSSSWNWCLVPKKSYWVEFFHLECLILNHRN